MAKSRRLSRFYVVLLLAIASMGLTYLMSRTTFFRVLESKTVDSRFRILGAQHQASKDIVIVEIDDTSLKALEDAFGRWPWPREVHSMFLRFMKTAGAKAVAYDVLFLGSDLDNPDGDASFVRETANQGAVINAIFLGDQENEKVKQVSEELLERMSIPAQPGFIEFPEIDVPFSGLAESSRALGHVSNVLDPDGPFRHYLPLANYRDRTIPSFALSVAMTTLGLNLKDIAVNEHSVSVGPIECPLNEDKRVPIWFNGGPGTYESTPYAYVVYAQAQIDEGEPPGLSPELFKDKIVLVGVSGAGLYDMFTTPFSGGAEDTGQLESGVQLGKMTGVEVHANVVDNLLHNRYLERVSESTNLLIGLLMALSVLVLVLYTSLWIGISGVAALLVGYLGIAQLAFVQRLQLPVAVVLFGWTTTVIVSFVYQYWVEGAEKRQVKSIFSRYVSKDIYRQLLENPESAQLGGNRRLVTVLFSDLRGFTTMSEKNEPEQVVALLNQYFTAMVEVVFRHHGTVDKFVGDMIMALFSAPVQDEDHADHAVQCALEMQRRLVELNKGWQAQGLPQLACGVGINSGDMIAGNVGAETVFSYTVIGDNVNLGARLESLCKEYKVSIIISEATKSLLRKEYSLRDLDEVLVKGKSKPVRIYEVQQG